MKYPAFKYLPIRRQVLALNKHFLAFLFFIFCISCSSPEKNTTLFELIPSKHSGLKFNNALDINDEFNILDFDYIYNGGGLAVGDFNNDGLPDIFFIGNMVSCKLYINQGDLNFTDVSKTANI